MVARHDDQTNSAMLDHKIRPKTSSRGRRLSARPFYTTVFFISLLAAYSFLAQTHVRRGAPAARGVSPAVYNGEQLLAPRQLVKAPECDDVHDADDQCAFVLKYCADDEAGLISYLRFYYCDMGKAKPVAFIILVAWLGLLFSTIGIAASDFFSINLSTISTILGLSESLAGVTFLAFGNGSPDVFSTFAAMGSNSASLAMGELIGAACFISGVVAGSMALVREFRVDKKTYARDICFFIVAVAFTMFFLADGNLHFWECWVMIGYYILYVITVVTWHWYSTRRKRRLRREAEARSHFYAPGHYSDELAGEPYRDDADDNEPGSRRDGSVPDISVLEQGPRIEIDGHSTQLGNEGLEHQGHQDDEQDDDHERMVAAEVASSMRVLRTRSRRSNTVNPIRPSLVGALEFRSALAQLQRESNLKLSTIHGRSYSEAHLPNRARREHSDAASDHGRPSPHTIALPSEAAGRARALSAGDNSPTAARMPSDLLRPTLAVDVASPSTDTRPTSPTPSYTIDGNLAPPPGGVLAGSAVTSTSASPQLNLMIPNQQSNQSAGSSPESPFPMFTDSPGMLTPHPNSELAEFHLPAPAQRDHPFADLPMQAEDPKPVSWWPYAILPPPHVLYATLFPTLQGWREKVWWDKIVSALSVPSIFLLVITLPVVETDTAEPEPTVKTDFDRSSNHAPEHASPALSHEPISLEPENEWQRFRRHALSRSNSYHSQSTQGEMPDLITFGNEETLVVSQGPQSAVRDSGVGKPASELLSISNANDEMNSWNRWLVCLQLYTGPLFSIFILWANLKEDFQSPGKTLVQMVLYTLLASSVLLGGLLVLTSEQTRPKYHYIFSFMGFIISIAWISTIAGEVVGVLKTMGVILGISEALLGLTIFAAGNSVGDLIADITVARLGYPVMALSACFGGPMLNILLGIGIGGVLMMVQKANHSHSGSGPKYEPYPVQVGGTLMISSITLLAILLGLLISVPLNKWVLSRKIGWSLIALWTISTIANVIIEVTGVWDQMS